MRKMLIAAGLVVASFLAAAAPTSAQNTTGLVVSVCGSPASPFVVGRPGPFTVDTTGTLCGPGSAPGGTPLNINLQQVAGVAAAAGNGATTAGTQRVTLASDSAGVITPGQQTSANSISVVLSSDNNAVTGNVASGATDSGSPVKSGGVYNSTLPTFTTGQRGDLQVGSRGSLGVTLFAQDSTTATSVGTPADNTGIPTGTLRTQSYGMLYTGSVGYLTRSISGATSAGTGTVAVHLAPTSATGGGVTSVVTAAVATSKVIKASAGNLYSLDVSADSTLSAAPWWVMVHNTTAAPAAGAVTPVKCFAVASGATNFSARWTVPIAFSTGISVTVSTAGCFTQTDSAHGFISGDAS